QESDDEDAPDSRHFRLAFGEGPQRQFIDAVLLGSVRGALADARALPAGVNTVGAHGHTALEAASYRGDLKMVTALLAAGAKPDGAPDRAPIGLAFTRKDTDAGIAIVNVLVKAGANVDGSSYGATLMWLMARHGNLAAVEALAALHADMNHGHGGYPAPLLDAADTGGWSIVEWMLHHGGDLWITDSFGDNLGLAAQIYLEPRIAAVQPPPEREALDRTVALLRSRGFPWPPPSPRQVLDA
ncbi:ankyrin repeat domain-containing protein, partial [Acidomonas methanolica]|uniref:ankyrin repeat domain-containing protein n=1 Tax=Acidomonas methanolica TaxID=437 RepID=UPI00211A5A6D